MDSDYDDSACSTPYVSAPSSPGRRSSSFSCNTNNNSYFYSAPTSPIHFSLSSSISKSRIEPSTSFEFEEAPKAGSMSSADELFLNGQIRPMKLSSHLQNPQMLAPLIDLDQEGENELEGTKLLRGRDMKGRERRRTRSMSPMRGMMNWNDGCEVEKECEITEEEEEEEEEEPTMSASSSRSSSGSRSSKRWIFLKEFLYRSKSEGQGRKNDNTNHRIWEGGSTKFWNKVSFSPIKDKKAPVTPASSQSSKKKEANVAPKDTPKDGPKEPVLPPTTKKKASPTNGVGKRQVPSSAHERHYKANRAQAEEMRKKTFLPYRQGLIGCLGFSSKSYGAVNGLAKALNPVSSR